MNVLLFLSVLLTVLIADTDPLIWPLPSSHDVSNRLSVSLSNSFTISTASSNTIIQNAIQRYKQLIFQHRAEMQPPSNDSTIENITINIKDDTDNDLNFGIDESYSLIFPGDGISCNKIWGCLRGLETFSQIIIYNFDLGYYQGYSVNVTDQPRFMWRGMLIDTSRHFLSIQTIQTVLDALSYAKYNTLHWHIVDAPSFPYGLI